MTQILRGKSISQGLLITRPRCHANRLHVWGGGRGGELSQNRLHQTLQIITTVVSRGPEDTSDSPNGFLTTRGPTAPPTPRCHLHSTVSPSTANNCWPRIWPPPSQRRAQRAIEEPTLLTAPLHPTSASAPRLGTLGPSSGSTTAALCLQSTSEFQTSPHAPQGDRRRAIGSNLNNAMWG